MGVCGRRQVGCSAPSWSCLATRADDVAYSHIRKEESCVRIRSGCAAFISAMILGCVLMPVMAARAWATEPGIPDISGSGAREGFEELLYSFDNFWGEPYAGSIVCTELAGHRIPGVISKEDAVHDVDFLFRVLKYGYAGYGFFGGDEVFLAARQGILADIDDLREGSLGINQFLTLLKRWLGFIQDGHFSIHGTIMCRGYRSFARFDMEFDESGGRFYARQTPDAWVVAVEGEEPSRWMKPSIGSDGEVFYCLGATSDASRDICVRVDWSDGSHEFVWLSTVGSPLVLGPAYELKYVDGIPVATSRSLLPVPEALPQLEALLRDVAELKEAPAAIVDLRSHNGGNDWYAMEWVKGFAGTHVCPSSFHAQLVTNTAAKMWENSTIRLGVDWSALRGMVPEGDSEGPPDARSWLAGNADPDRPGWSQVSVIEGVKAENDTLLVVLIDSNVCSAGESFVGYLRQLENVVFVGINTYGMMLSGNVGVCMLPKSELVLICGTKISLGEDLSNRDGLGHMPDFWVDPEQALERAVKYIQAMQAGAGNR